MTTDHTPDQPEDEEGPDMFGNRKNEPVPSHRRSHASCTEGYDVYAASSWRRDGKLGSWVCGSCSKRSTDPLSPHQDITLADCRCCGRTNRISLSPRSRGQS